MKVLMEDNKVFTTRVIKNQFLKDRGSYCFVPYKTCIKRKTRIHHKTQPAKINQENCSQENSDGVALSIVKALLHCERALSIFMRPCTNNKDWIVFLSNKQLL